MLRTNHRRAHRLPPPVHTSPYRRLDCVYIIFDTARSAPQLCIAVSACAALPAFCRKAGHELCMPAMNRPHSGPFESQLCILGGGQLSYHRIVYSMICVYRASPVCVFAQNTHFVWLGNRNGFSKALVPIFAPSELHTKAPRFV